MDDRTLALFLMLGQSGDRAIAKQPEIASGRSLMLSPDYDLSGGMTAVVRDADEASEGYRLIFVFESYLRDLVVEALSQDPTTQWWDKVPTDVQDYVRVLEETEDVKQWMALGSRDKSALMTLPQLLRVIEHNWKDVFADVLRDKLLLQEARAIVHLRNTLCHMSSVSEEEVERIRQVMRDWFRMVAP
jgi:hypothetical protein